MTGNGSFDNQFDDFSPISAYNILNEKRDAISENLYTKLQNYKSEKLSYLIAKPVKNIFHHDGTVYTGSAGLALFYLMSSLGKSEGYDDILKKALEFLELKNVKGKRISFLCGDAGMLAIATVISYKLGNRRPDNLPQYGNLAQRLTKLISLLNDSPDELLYGKAGYLYAVLFVNKHVAGNGNDLIPANHIVQIIASILRAGKEFAQQKKSESPLLWQWHEKIYLGAAHGVAGILYMLLQAREYIDANEVRDYIKPSLDWLLNQKFSGGNYPSSLGSASGDRLVQWCHGAPGFVPLCLLAYQVFLEEKYLETAIQCGDVIWQRGICTKGYSICHGVSGNAYSFLQLYQATKNPQHLYRACCFMEWCVAERPGTELHRPDRPASLFEGLLGRIYLAEDIMHPLQAKFPAFCL
ncbi:lanC-like protein 2 [Maniola hyperantus]|uniref:lanC-like protein 2 n=1 Tax=Aphantopus hyperantus TaxID=2795564 RepID=UPI0015688C6E|nr:lanC-like protein 2 [Maniola hyperantus]